MQGSAPHPVQGTFFKKSPENLQKLSYLENKKGTREGSLELCYKDQYNSSAAGGVTGARAAPP